MQYCTVHLGVQVWLHDGFPGTSPDINPPRFLCANTISSTESRSAGRTYQTPFDVDDRTDKVNPRMVRHQTRVGRSARYCSESGQHQVSSDIQRSLGYSPQGEHICCLGSNDDSFNQKLEIDGTCTLAPASIVKMLSLIPRRSTHEACTFFK